MKKNTINQRDGKSLIKNIGYNMISQVVALIVPLLTSPYIARVFNADLIGQYSYALANSSYFVLLECLGFSLYGQIKIAAHRDDKDEISILFFEIMTLKVLLMMASIIVYMVMILPQGDSFERKLCLLMILNIVASGVDVTWFLNGMEEFRTIAVRSICVRLINIIGIFTLIKSENDLLLYGIIMQGANLLANLAVYPSVFKEIVWRRPKDFNIIKHFKPAAVYFVPGLVNTIFSASDKTMLGMWTSDYEVGIYEQANKISQICMNAVCTIGNVILPRASYLYHKDASKEEANELVYKSLQIVQIISVPATLGIIAVSDEFIPIFFGQGYEKSAVVLVILSFNVMVTALCNLCGQQCLIAREKQKQYNAAIVLTAIINVTLNLGAIRIAQSIGAAVASVLASVICLIAIIYMSKDVLTFKNVFVRSWKCYASAFVMYIVLIGVRNILYGTVQGIAMHILIGIVVYVLILLLLKEQVILMVCKKIAKKIRSRK